MKLFGFGFGYSAEALGRRLRAKDWMIAGTVRSPDRKAALEGRGVEAVLFQSDGDTTAARTAFAGATPLLHSIPPDREGDPVLRRFRDDLSGLGSLRWIGYLSTVGVYGDQGGGWIDEETAADPKSERGRRRVEAEREWLDFGREIGVTTQIFRLAGIYGAGRSAITNLRAGSAHRIVKPGQVFNRIHVEDIATVLEASIARPRAGAIYNVADDEPAPPQDVVTFAAAVLGVDPPPEIPFDQAELSPIARSFYSDNKRVRNSLIKDELGVTLAFPTYRDGITALAKEA